MKKTIYTLALVLLLLSACGKKDNNNDDKLLSKSNNVKTVKTSSATEKSTVDNYSSETDTEDESLRPVIVTVLENGSPSRGAIASIEKWGKKPTFWSAKTDKKGVAKILISAKQLHFRVTASKDNYAIVSFYTNRLTKGTTPIHVELNLEERGIVITAYLIADKDIDEKDVSARIKPEKHTDNQFVSAAVSAICDDDKIVFPSIKKGLKRLKVMVKAKGFAESYSDYFDTCDDEEDKTVTVNLLSGIKFSGKAVRSNGEVITNLSFRATPRGQYEKRGNPGHINENIAPDADGNFEIDGLLPEHYRFSLTTDEAQPIRTNVVLYSDEINYMEFVFPELKYQNVNGIVIYEQSGKPAEGIEIKYKSWNYRGKEIKTATDEKGNFNISVPITERGGTELIVNEPGFAKIKRRIERYAGETITLLLRESGVLTGMITTEKGEPISGVRVNIEPETTHSKSSKASFSSRDSRWEERSAYRAQSEIPSDINGMYVISNAAAPQSYRINAWVQKEYFLPHDNDRKVRIEPGKTTVYDFTMFIKPAVMVKLRDEEGTPVLKYSLRIKTTYKNGSSSGTRSVNLSDENDWYRAETWSRNANVKLSLRAEDEDGRVAEKKNISIEPGEEYKFILTLSNSVMPDLAGFVYKSDMSPYIDGHMWVNVNRQHGYGTCDHLGFFEITGLEAEKGTIIKLHTNYDNNSFTTNVFAGDDNIEWILPEQNRILGRVCIGDIYTPATNFAVSIMSTHNKKAFYSENGIFSLPIRNYYTKRHTPIKIYVFVSGYAPEIRELELDGSKTYDIGDVIVMNKPATIIGRVIDHEDNPVSANISLMKIKGTGSEHVLNCRNDEDDGTFEFTDLPPDTYVVSAYTRLKSVKSDNFDLRSDETYTLPDLIIIETNSVKVLLKFVLPDGGPAVNARVSYFNKSTDENGFLKEKMRPGRHDNWSIRIEEELYNTEKFEIKKDTEEITVNLIQVPSITGTVTLDGKPLDNAYLNFQGDRNHYSTRVYDGKFEVQAKPGKYTVTYPEIKVVAIVELSESGPNKINFKSGNSTFEFVFPVEGNWNVSLSRKIDNKSVHIANLNTIDDSSSKITKLSAGDYSIYAYCRDGDFRTNISVKSVLKSGETKKITF